MSKQKLIGKRAADMRRLMEEQWARWPVADPLKPMAWKMPMLCNSWLFARHRLPNNSPPLTDGT